MSSDPANLNWRKIRETLEQSEKELVAALGPPDSSIDEFYSTVPIPDGSEAKVKVWRSNKTPESERPLILLFHGGGFFGGSMEMMTRPGREFAQEFGAVVVSSCYRLAPENRFPASAMDGLEIMRYLSREAEKAFGANLSKGFIVGGFSAGGNIAAVISYLSKNGPLMKYPVTGSLIGIPHLLIEAVVPEKYKHLWTSRADNADENPFFKGKGDEQIVNLMEGDASSRLFSPLNDLERLGGLPRTYVQVGDLDPLRDDGVVYAKALEDSGVETRMDNCKEVGHSCFSIWYDEKLESQRELKRRTMEGVGWLLGRE